MFMYMDTYTHNNYINYTTWLRLKIYTLPLTIMIFFFYLNVSIGNFVFRKAYLIIKIQVIF